MTFPTCSRPASPRRRDVAADAERVQATLGVGKLSEDENQDLGTILVVVGADFVPPSSGGATTGD